jgi:hypothetical protein
MDISPKKIGLVCPSNGAGTEGFFKMLTDRFPGTIESANGRDYDSFSGVIVFNGDIPKQDLAVPSLFVMPSSRVLENARVQFAGSSSVPAVFRKREVGQTQVAVLDQSQLNGRDEFIASADGHPIWTARADDSCRRQICAVSLEQIENLRPLFRYLSADTFMPLLPMIHFIRQVAGEDGWSDPPLRANIMLDDPNLHCTSYGWINFRELAQHARAHNYHVSMATIPLDTWMECKQAVGFFADNQARLSLLIHGNNHLDQELASFSSDEQRLASLAQALQRISRLEAKTSLAVSRVMAAPHEACSEQTLRVMARLGFEAVCISPGSLHNCNSGKSWVQSIGLGMSDFVAGLPVIPRFEVGRPFQNAILLAAYLDQPIIPFGHHREVAGGFDLLEDLANFTNSLGQVRWMDMKGIARSNYKTRTEGSLLRVRSYARVVNVRIPSSVTQVSVHRPKMDDVVKEGICIRRPGQSDQVFPQYLGEPFPVQPGADLEITSILQNQIDPSTVRQPKPRIWPLARRILTEGRDRLSPFACRLTGKVRRNGGRKT